MRMLLPRDPGDAKEARRWGLIKGGVPQAAVMARAETTARHIVKMPPVTLRMMKEFVVRFGDLPTDQALARAEPDQQSADPGDDRWGGGAPGLQREAPAQFHRRAAPRRRCLGRA